MSQSPWPKADDGLVARAMAGDPDAFGMLYRTWREPINKYIYARVGHAADTSELTAKVFELAWRGIRRSVYAHDGRWAGWLATIARNVIADFYKSGYKRLEIPIEVASGWVAGVDSTAPVQREPHSLWPEAALDTFAETRDMQRAIRGVLAQLSPDQRAVLECRFLRELSVAETADQMGKPPSSVKALQWRALGTVRKLMGVGDAPRPVRGAGVRQQRRSVA